MCGADSPTRYGAPDHPRRPGAQTAGWRRRQGCGRDADVVVRCRQRRRGAVRRSAHVVVEPAQQPGEVPDVVRRPQREPLRHTAAAPFARAGHRRPSGRGQLQQPGPGVAEVRHPLEEAEPLELADVAARRGLVQVERRADVGRADPLAATRRTARARRPAPSSPRRRGPGAPRRPWPATPSAPGAGTG